MDAVNATGMHIQLRGGVTFNQQFLVDGNAANGASLHSLTVESFGIGQATVAAPGTLAVSFNVPTSGTPNKFAIIGVENGANVNVQNLKVDGLGAGDQANSGDFAGIFFLNASGKVLDSTVTGIRNGGTGGTLDGTQHGNAIVGFATDNAAHSLEVGNTHVTDFQKTGILINGLGLTTNIHDSFVTGVGENSGHRSKWHPGQPWRDRLGYRQPHRRHWIRQSGCKHRRRRAGVPGWRRRHRQRQHHQRHHRQWRCGHLFPRLQCGGRASQRPDRPRLWPCR